MAEKSPKSENNDAEILRVAKERYDLASTTWDPIYKKGEEDLRILSGDQWHSTDREIRKRDSRPILTVNKLPQHLNQVVNDQRQNRPSIKVSPVDNGADVETAKILQGLIRNIQNDSNADAARDRAFEGAAGNSFGFYRIISKYVSPTSFDQKLMVSRISDPFMVKIDPFSKEPDGSDMKWAFYECEYSKDDYKAEYPNSELCSSFNWGELSTSSQGWVKDKSVRVAEYYTLDYETEEISQARIQTVNELGQPVFQVKVMKTSEVPEGAEVLNTRKTQVPKVNHYKINGVEVLERTVFPGIWIPIIPVFGKEIIVKGERILESLIRHSIDSQRMLNYMTSAEAEAIGLAPKAPYIAAEGQIPEKYAGMWKNANSQTFSTLIYKPTDHKGQMLPPPQRNTYEPPVQAIAMSRMQASDDIKSTTGIYDSTLGARSNENSGRAIERRNAQSQTSNYHFIDNLTRSIKHEGRILVGAIPFVYDTERVERIIGEEGDEKLVTLNQEYENEKGEKVLYDLSVGEYDVVVETGPNYATKRQEAAATMMEFTKAMPQQAAVISDLMVKNFDFPGNTEMAERLRKTLPPGIAEDKEKKEIPPEAQAQMQEMQQMIEQMTQKLNEQNQLVNTKKMELESKERIENMKLQNALILKQLELQGAAANEVMRAELQSIQNRLALLDQYAPINDDFNEGEPSPDQMMPPSEQQQPTDGISSGQFMGG